MHVSPALHCMPQPPQWFGSVDGSKQPPPHMIWPVPHTHTPLVQVPAPQSMPQPPQLAGSVEALTQLMPHAMSPVPHIAEHEPAEQNGVVPLHVVLQPPQWSGSDVVSTQLAPHIIEPEGQPPPIHMPPTQL
jgi:hypothetical protein